MAEISGTKGIVNIQPADDGQILTNSIQNVAEGKTDNTGTPDILPFLLRRGVGLVCGIDHHQSRTDGDGH